MPSRAREYTRANVQRMEFAATYVRFRSKHVCFCTVRFGHYQVANQKLFYLSELMCFVRLPDKVARDF